MSYTQIAVERRGAVAWLFHDRPALRNAESSVLLDELDAALREAAADDDIRVIVIAGKGDHFSAGHDLKEGQEKRQGFSVEQRYAYEEAVTWNTPCASGTARSRPSPACRAPVSPAASWWPTCAT